MFSQIPFDVLTEPWSFYSIRPHCGRWKFDLKFMQIIARFRLEDFSFLIRRSSANCNSYDRKFANRWRYSQSHVKLGHHKVSLENCRNWFFSLSLQAGKWVLISLLNNVLLLSGLLSIQFIRALCRQHVHSRKNRNKSNTPTPNNSSVRLPSSDWWTNIYSAVSFAGVWHPTNLYNKIRI